MLRLQDSNLDLTAPKAVVLPLHQGGPRAPQRARIQSARRDVRPDAHGVADARDTWRHARRTDEVDRIVDAWLRERPDLDFSPLQVLSRVGRLATPPRPRAPHAPSRAPSSSRGSSTCSRRCAAPATPYQLSPKALLQQTLVSSGTMTNRIDRLVERGLVERRTDPHDGRGILVLMTAQGLARVDAAITRLVDAEAELLDGLSAADAERLAGLLRKLSLGFDAEGLSAGG